jgi:hypothetical protein
VEDAEAEAEAGEGVKADENAGGGQQSARIVACEVMGCSKGRLRDQYGLDRVPMRGEGGCDGAIVACVGVAYPGLSPTRGGGGSRYGGTHARVRAEYRGRRTGSVLVGDDGDEGADGLDSEGEGGLGEAGRHGTFRFWCLRLNDHPDLSLGLHDKTSEKSKLVFGGLARVSVDHMERGSLLVVGLLCTSEHADDLGPGLTTVWRSWGQLIVGILCNRRACSNSSLVFWELQRHHGHVETYMLALLHCWQTKSGRSEGTRRRLGSEAAEWRLCGCSETKSNSVREIIEGSTYPTAGLDIPR